MTASGRRHGNRRDGRHLFFSEDEDAKRERKTESESPVFLRALFLTRVRSFVQIQQGGRGRRKVKKRERGLFTFRSLREQKGTKQTKSSGAENRSNPRRDDQLAPLPREERESGRGRSDLGDPGCGCRERKTPKRDIFVGRKRTKGANKLAFCFSTSLTCRTVPAARASHNTKSILES